MSANITLRAGATALRRLREEGFSRDAFGTLIGASGGPKWLVLSQLDRVLAQELIPNRSRPLDVIGSSIGSFRHACLAQPDPLKAIERFEEAYLSQVYDGQPSAGEVTRVSREIVDALLGTDGARAILDNPRVRSHVVTTRLPGLRSDRGWPLRGRLGAAALANAVTRRSLGIFFERAVFSSHPAPTPRFSDWRTHQLALSELNFADALMASGSIPFVMSAVRDIPGAPQGVYLDGGILDYHFDFRFETAPGLILYPHFFDRIVPGWLDKSLPWRRAEPSRLDEVVLIAPSAEFVRSLPGGRVPDRTDFTRLSTEDRLHAWATVVDRCRTLSDELGELIAMDRLADLAQPFA